MVCKISLCYILVCEQLCNGCVVVSVYFSWRIWCYKHKHFCLPTQQTLQCFYGYVMPLKYKIISDIKPMFILLMVLVILHVDPNFWLLFFSWYFINTDKFKTSLLLSLLFSFCYFASAFYVVKVTLYNKFIMQYVNDEFVSGYWSHNTCRMRWKPTDAGTANCRRREYLMLGFLS